MEVSASPDICLYLWQIYSGISGPIWICLGIFFSYIFLQQSFPCPDAGRLVRCVNLVNVLIALVQMDTSAVVQCIDSVIDSHCGLIYTPLNQTMLLPILLSFFTVDFGHISSKYHVGFDSLSLPVYCILVREILSPLVTTSEEALSNSIHLMHYFWTQSLPSSTS